MVTKTGDEIDIVRSPSSPPPSYVPYKLLIILILS